MISERELVVRNEQLWQDIYDITNETFIPEKKVGLERPVEETDFIDEKQKIEINFHKLCDLFNAAVCNDDFSGFHHLPKDFQRKVVVNSLLVCCEHSDASSVWTTGVTVKFSKDILQVLCEFLSSKSINEILVCNSVDNILKSVFVTLRPKLLKDTWKCYPAAVISFVYILMKIQAPQMGQVLNLVMPTTLILIDDYVNSNRVTGVKCLQHIVENVTKGELLSYCDIDILYKTLEPLLYNVEADTVNPVINCLLTVVNKKLIGQDKLQWTNYDDIMNILLPSIEMEHKLALRSAYMESLPRLLEAMGLSCVRWSKRLISIFEEYAAIPHDRGKCLNAMFSFMKVTWPRLAYNFSPLTTIILKTLSDIIDDKHKSSSNDNEEDIIGIVYNCLNVLREVVPDKMRELRNDIVSNKNLSPSFKEVFVSIKC